MKAWAGLYRWLDGVKLHPQPPGYSRQYYSTEYYRGKASQSSRRQANNRAIAKRGHLR